MLYSICVYVRVYIHACLSDRCIYMCCFSHKYVCSYIYIYVYASLCVPAVINNNYSCYCSVLLRPTCSDNYILIVLSVTVVLINSVCMYICIYMLAS